MDPVGGIPRVKRQRERPEETMACKEKNCGRRDAPIRHYAKRIRLKRERPFAAEYALLAELGLRRK